MMPVVLWSHAMEKPPPKLITVGVIADTLGVTPDRVSRILQTRKHIQPTAYAGNTRLFTSNVIAQVRYELNAIDAKRQGVSRG